MDLFLNIPEEIQHRIFFFDDDDIQTYVTKARAVLEANTLDVKTKALNTVSEFGISKIRNNNIKLQHVLNPFKPRTWRRVPNRNIFKYRHRKVSIPKGTFRKDLKQDTAYIVEGYQASGSYGYVNTFVVFQNQICVMKSMQEDKNDWFELVTQAYLHEFCKRYRRIQVPSLLFLNRSYSSKTTRACMPRANGFPVGHLRGPTLMKALAHVMKALFQLQKDVHFMHRDLSASNVWFDPQTNDVTFIDFGMACVNPTLQKMSWQATGQEFYELLADSHASMCTNRSYDPSTLISYLSLDDIWCNEQHVQMKKDYKEAIVASNNETAKKPLLPPKKDGQYTTIRGQNWKVGNELIPYDVVSGRGDGPHWWLYNMVEFPVERWYPENVLKRILPQLPLNDWFAIRLGWSSTFDECMPKNIRVRLTNGNEGTLMKLVRKKCRILVEGVQTDVDPSLCKIINDNPPLMII